MKDLKKYAQIKVTPSSTSILTVSNLLGVIPKYIHITCPHDSAPYSSYGYIKEVFASQLFGAYIGTNGSTGRNAYNAYYPKAQTPTSQQDYYLSDSEISFYKGSGSVSGRWHTDTEYTVHIYA